MAQLCLGVGVINPAVHNLTLGRLDLNTPERERLGGVEVGPSHLLKQVIWI